MQAGWGRRRSLSNLLLAALASHHVAQGLTQLELENLWGWRWHNLTGQPLPLLYCPCGEKGSPHIQSQPLLLQFLSIVSHPCSMYLCEEPGSLFPIPSPQAGQLLWGPLKPSLLQADQAPLLWPLFWRQVLRSWPPCGPHWLHSSLSIPLLYWGA